LAEPASWREPVRPRHEQHPRDCQRHQTGCQVIGLTTSENAARVLAGEGMTETYNVARFLGKVKDSDQTRAARAGVRGRRAGAPDEADRSATTSPEGWGRN
jgi:hypothetical protein